MEVGSGIGRARKPEGDLKGRASEWVASDGASERKGGVYVISTGVFEPGKRGKRCLEEPDDWAKGKQVGK